MANETKIRDYGAGIPKTKLDYNDPMQLLEIEGLARDGFDDKQIAQILDVSRQTFGRNKLKKVDPTPENVRGLSALYLALMRGRRPLNVIVENSLYKRAIGQTVITTKVTKKREYNPELGHFETNIYDETITTELPGDVNAQIQWLKNRKPDVYNNQPTRVDVTTGGDKLPAAEAPKITMIEHVAIAADEVKKELEIISNNTESL